MREQTQKEESVDDRVQRDLVNLIEFSIGLRDPNLSMLVDALNADVCILSARCTALEQENQQLRAAQQAERDRFDRDLKNYSSGYTQALDDALKGTP